MSDETRPRPAPAPTPDVNQRTDSDKLDELLERESAAPAVAVSPTDHTSDRIQSDADQAENSDKLAELLRKQAEIPAQDATAVSPTDRSSDRKQADADQTENVERNTADRTQSDADQVITVDRLDRLIEVSAKLSTSAVTVAASTREDLAASAQQRRRFTLGMFAMAALVLLLLVPILILIIQSVRQRNAIQDCVNPAGTCFQQDKVGAARIAKIQGNQVLVAACAQEYVKLPFQQRIVAIRKCVLAGQVADAKRTAKPTPTPKPTPTLPRSAPRPGAKPQSSAAPRRPLTGVRQPAHTTAARNGSRPSAGGAAPPRRTTAPRPSTAPAPSTPPLILCTRLPVVGSICI